jgi:mono/diheme cytochrome c family protein
MQIRPSLLLAMTMTMTVTALAKPRSIVLPEETTQFIEAPGAEAARNNCLACHSADYIATQPPKKGQAFWAAEVQKMIKAYKAPIEPADAEIIAKYLSENY